MRRLISVAYALMVATIVGLSAAGGWFYWDRVQNFSGRARMSSMLWTFQVNQADGVACPDGSTAPSSETYAFSDETLTGTHTTVHGAVCGLQPKLSKQPFSLQLIGPPPSPVQRYPLYCNNIAMCY